MVRIVFKDCTTENHHEITSTFDLVSATDSESDFQCIISRIMSQFEIKYTAIDLPFYCLMALKSMKMINDQRTVDALSPSDTLHLVDLRLFTKECISNLKECHSAALPSVSDSESSDPISPRRTASLSKLKLLVFRLHDLLNSGLFAEEFIAFRGMEVLTLIIREFTAFRNVQSYSINCLCKTVLFLNGLEWVQQNESVIFLLYEFIKNKSNIVVIRGALWMLQIIGEHGDRAFDLIHGAALQIANFDPLEYRQRIQSINNLDKKQKENGSESLPFLEMVECLSVGDLDIVSNALNLVNTMIKKAPSESMKRLFIHNLVAVGIMEKLLSLRHSHRIEIHKLLAEFQDLVKRILPISELNVFVLQSKIKELKQEIEGKEEALSKMARKVAMIDVLDREFVRVHTALNDAYDQGLLVNSVSNTRSRRGHGNEEEDSKAQGAFEIIHEMRMVRESCKKLEIENKALLHDAVTAKQQNEDLQTQNQELSKKYDAIRKEHQFIYQQSAQLKEEIKALNSKNERLSIDIQSARTSISDLQRGVPSAVSSDSTSTSTPSHRPKPAFLASINQIGGKNEGPKTTSSLPQRPRPAFLASINGLKSGKTSSTSAPPSRPAFLASIRGGNALKSGSKRARCSAKKKKAQSLNGKKVEIRESEFVANKAAMKPHQRMKALHWKRKVIRMEKDIDSESECKRKGDIVWNSVQELDGLDFAEFESLFALKQRASTQKKVAPKKKKNIENAVIQCLPKMRAQHLGILLSSLPPVDELRDCIINVDRRVLDSDKLQMILTKFPSNEEIESIGHFEAEQKTLNSKSKPLGMAEQFCLSMASISQCRQRLTLWIFINGFEDEHSALMEAVSCYKRGCIELQQNKNLPQIFSVVLTAGNYMNGGTRKGQADGFDLDVLRKLDGVKATKKGSNAAVITLLDYVVKCCFKRNGNQRIVLSDSMQNVLRCTKRGKLSEIKHRVMALVHRVKGIENMKQRLDATKQDEVRFLEFITHFVVEKEPEVKALKEGMEDAVKGYGEIIAFYDETTHKSLDQSLEFINILADFIKAFDAKMKRIQIEFEQNVQGSKSKQNEATKHRKHNLGQKIPGFTTNQKAAGMLMHELKTALTAKHLAL